MLDFRNIRINNRMPVYIQIAHYVKQQVLLGKAVPGDELPSRREIAAQLNINPNTAQKAYKLMEDEGYVVTNGNLGSEIYVDDKIYAKIKEELTHEMTRQFIQSAKEVNLSFKDVIELLSRYWDETGDGRQDG
ncbi:MAG: GntR family transcriptional regulator [Clostridiaceae bacterium]|nr:GntR family transcriptional regulator [Clostridiaceae bacterium]